MSYSEFESGNAHFYAPDLLKTEVANSFRTNILRKRITEDKAIQTFTRFLALPIYYEPVDCMNVFLFAIEHSLSFYDAHYLYLSKRHNIPPFLPLTTHWSNLLPANDSCYHENKNYSAVSTRSQLFHNINHGQTLNMQLSCTFWYNTTVWNTRYLPWQDSTQKMSSDFTRILPLIFLKKHTCHFSCRMA